MKRRQPASAALGRNRAERERVHSQTRAESWVLDAPAPGELQDWGGEWGACVSSLPALHRSAAVLRTPRPEKGCEQRRPGQRCGFPGKHFPEAAHRHPQTQQETACGYRQAAPSRDQTKLSGTIIPAGPTQPTSVSANR